MVSGNKHYQDRCGANIRIEAVIVIGVAEHTVKACTVDDGVNTGDTIQGLYTES